MEISKTDGIILKSRPSGESDITSVILTSDYGKKRFIFKGLKKSRKRSIAAVEPGSVINLLYYNHEDREFQIVNEFIQLMSFAEIRNDYNRIMHLFFLLEIVEKTTGFGIKDQVLYAMLVSAVEKVSSAEHLEYLTSFFILHLLRIGGILPDYSKCEYCGRNCINQFHVSAVDLKPACKNCINKGPVLPAGTSAFVIASLKNKYGEINFDRFCREEILDLIFHQSLFLEKYYHIEIKSKGYILHP
ncbi:MAG: DNA repair protein RecO [Spirochaetes bacterium]|nr:DNA repair protein RecO [Spirochaetota bacterium]